MANTKNLESRLAHYHKHIDNGGITVDIAKSEDEKGENRSLIISLEAEYFGYPSVNARLVDYGFMSSNDLKEIGLAFLRAATVLEKNENKEGQ